MSYCNKLDFFYNKESLVYSLQRTNAVALNPLDTTQAYTLAILTSPWVVYNDVGSYGTLNIFYEVRELNNITISTIVYNFVHELYGNLSFNIALPRLLFEKNKIYETSATYRDGIFVSSPAPRIVMLVLDDPAETIKYTVYF